MERLFLIGANKAGTTAVHHFLAAHPQIFMTVNKEPSYYSWDPAAGRAPGPSFVTDAAAYEELFALARDARVAGESSTAYLPNRTARERIHTEHPTARILMILRDPSERAHSAHSMMVQRGAEPMVDFADAVERELGGDRTFDYLRLGRYADDVAAWRESFPGARITFYQDLAADPRAFVAGIHEWLGVDPFDGADVGHRHNVSVIADRSRAYRILGSPRARAVARRLVPSGARRRARHRLEQRARATPLDAETRRVLVEYYESDVRALEDLTGRDLTAWRTV